MDGFKQQVAHWTKELIKKNLIVENLARGVYNSKPLLRVRFSINPWRTKRDKEILISSQVLGDFKNLKSTLMFEACNFFNMSENEILSRIKKDSIKQEWFKKERKDKEQIEEFYETQVYLFDDILKTKLNGMGFIGLRKLIGNLELALKLKDALGVEYLDYGCGVGDCPVLFGKYGFDVTIADISTLMLNFTSYRLENRGITFKAINLKTHCLPKDYFSFITCFDVLEHSIDPLGTMEQIRNSLKIGGIVFLYFAYGIDQDNPTHIIHNNYCIYDIRKMGFTELKKERDKIMRDRDHLFILKKV